MTKATPKAEVLINENTNIDADDQTLISDLVVESPGTIVLCLDVTWGDHTYIDLKINGATAESAVDPTFRQRLSPFQDGTTENQMNMKVPYYRITKANTGGGTSSKFEVVLSMVGAQKLNVTVSAEAYTGTKTLISKAFYYVGKGI